MLKPQCARLRRGGAGKSWILLRKQGTLQLARGFQVFLQLRIFLAQFFRVLGQLLLSSLARRDVSGGRNQAKQFPLVIVERHLGYRHPDLVPDTVHCFVDAAHDWRARSQDVEIFGAKFRRYLIRQEIEEGLADYLRRILGAEETAV